MQAQTYEVRASSYIRGVAIVSPADGSPTSDIARLCEAFSGGRFSFREHGFRMNSVALKHFMRAARLGCKSSDGQTVDWQSPSGEKFYTFSAKHPARALRCISQEP